MESDKQIRLPATPQICTQFSFNDSNNNLSIYQVWTCTDDASGNPYAASMHPFEALCTDGNIQTSIPSDRERNYESKLQDAGRLTKERLQCGKYHPQRHSHPLTLLAPYWELLCLGGRETWHGIAISLMAAIYRPLRSIFTFILYSAVCQQYFLGSYKELYYSKIIYCP